MPSRTGPLRLRAFRWFFAGRLASLTGSAMTPVALAFAVLDASGRIGDLAVVLAAQSVPMLVLLLVGGVVADRVPRGAVLVVANTGAGLTQAATAYVLVGGGYALGTVVVLVALNGACAAFTMPALSGIVTELVPAGGLQRANSLLAVSRGAVRVVGPGLAGIVVATAGGGWALAVDAAGHLVAPGTRPGPRGPAR